MSPKKTLKRILLPTLLLISQLSFSQNRTITGRVTDSRDSSGISGITVTAKGSKAVTQTDNNGNYQISVKSDVNTLVFSSVGYAKQEVDISGKTSVDVPMVITNAQLSEVVVTGYGTRKVKDATGSVALVTTKDFNKGVISTPEQLLQGRTPGVIVSPSSGEPGAAATINIRGTASIRSNQEPLFVIDGVPMSTGGTSGIASGVEGSSTPKNPLSFLNPNDIESISILKDASSAAIYGSRGANGVVLITTKSGKGRSGSFSFNVSTSVSKIANRYDLLEAGDFLAAVKKANIESGATEANASIAVAGVDKGASTDWQDQIFRTGVNQTYNLSWGFSHKSSALRVSGSYDDQQGIIRKSGLKRATGRANFSQKFLEDKLKFDLILTFSNVRNAFPPLSNNAGYQGSLMGAAIAFNPTYPVFDASGQYFDPSDGNRNPAEMLDYFNDKDKINRFLSSVSGSYEVVKGLVYKVAFGYDNSKSERLSFADPRLGNAYGGTNNVFGKDLGNSISGNGRTVKNNIDIKTIVLEHTVTYDKAFSNGSVINAVVGYAYNKYESEYRGTVGWGLNTPVVLPGDVFVREFDNFKNYYDFVPDFTQSELQSYFGRVNYTIADKYLLTATMRIDGSSKFGKNNKYGQFPAFAVKWRVLKENFGANWLGKVFSDFSIRANYGKLGSQDGIGAYDAVDLQQTWKGNSGNDETVLLHQGNPNLKWEEATTTGAGVDFSTLDNRLSGTIDYYHTNRKNLLFFTPTPGGFAAQSNWWVNLPGKVINKGWEFGINYKAIRAKKFSWEVNYNMTLIHNELKEFNVVVNTGQVNGQGLTGAYAQTFENGYPLFTWKMPVFLGFDGNGNSRFQDNSRPQFVGSALPKFLGGLTNSFSLGRWSASIFFNAVTGFYVYNNTANALLIKGSVKTAHNITYAAAATSESPLNAAGPSTRFLEKGDFLRFSNATVGYTFALRSKAIKTLGLYASGQNLAKWTKYSGLDPEVNIDHQLNGVPSRGFDYTGYPKSVTVTVGLNLGF